MLITFSISPFIASAWVVLWNTLDTKHPTSNSSMRASGIICLDLKTGLWIGGAVSCPCSLAIVIFVCQHQTPLRVTRQTMRRVQPDSLLPQSYLPVPLRHQRKPATNVSPVSWASISPTIILPGSDLGNPSDDPSLKKDGSPKAVSTADVSLGAMVAIPVVAGSSSLMEQSSITITNPAVSTSVQTVVATGSTTQPMPADVKLAVLSYGDVKFNLPPIGSLIRRGKVADGTTATSTTDSVRSDFNKTLLTLAQEASKMYALSGDGAPINTGFPAVDGQNIVTTTTYSLGGSSIGNLSPRGQQMNWLCQSTKEALETARSQPYPSTRGRGCPTRKRSSSKRQVEKPNTPPTSDE